jgi:hypothetical protein
MMSDRTLQRTLGPEKPVSIENMRDEVRRELNYRIPVYQRLVQQKKMNAHERNRRIDVMQAILTMLEGMDHVPGEGGPGGAGPDDASGSGGATQAD